MFPAPMNPIVAMSKTITPPMLDVQPRRSSQRARNRSTIHRRSAKTEYLAWRFGEGRVRLVLLIGMLCTVAGAAAAGGPAAVSYVGHAKVAAALAKGGRLVTAPDLTVLGSHRTGPGQVEVHERETDVFYITEGEATFVTGGSIEGARV